MPADEIREAIEEELGATVEELYASFDDAPIASASIGQVHRATLDDGREVVVKVQRPGIEEVVEADLDLLLRQARFLENRSETMRDYNLVAIGEELARSAARGTGLPDRGPQRGAGTDEPGQRSAASSSPRSFGA